MSQPSRLCPVCERGTLSAERYTEQIQHNGKSVTVQDLERYRCDTCGADPVLTEQIRRNQVRICDAKRQADGYFTGDEIKCLRERLGLSQPDAALLFGGGPNAFSKYERGEVVQSLPMDRLLRCAAGFPTLVDYLRVLAGVDVLSSESDAYVEFRALSLNDPWYTSRPVRGRKVVVLSAKEETSVVSLVDRRTKAA